jgi:microcompartment protein CcmK/EutM
MVTAQVVGHAVSSHSHPSLKGCRMLVCVPLDPQDRPCGEPMIAIDWFGAGMHSKVFVSSDGIAARDLVHDQASPVRNFIQGVIDDPKPCAN